MGKMESIIKSEIQRLAKREIHRTLAPLAQDIRLLKNKVSQLRKIVLLLERSTAHQQKISGIREETLKVAPEEVKASRFSPQLIRSLRRHLGISQRELALLTDVSVSAAHQWEIGKFKPKKDKKMVLVALRKLGRREVRRLLEKKAPRRGDR
ncbi:MAG: helix-turn-helix domain-containing protein [Deltaproteobacteria bacterium]|nr:helix-turn-helix domain-containing protein [Deltaproteobacteria bacterium]